MTDIFVTKKDEVHAIIECEDSTSREIVDLFTFEAASAKFSPAYRNRKWDGKTRLFSDKTRKLYIGLLPHLCVWASANNYSVEIDSSVPLPSKKPSKEDTVKFFEDKLNIHAEGKKISPRPFQISAFRHIVGASRCVIESATSSGKSLTIYSLCRLYSEILPKDKKILLIVPSVNLVYQMFSDFEDYSSEDDWNAHDHCHMVFSGQDKIDMNKKIVISTYQSIYDLPKKYFKVFGTILGDEAHLFQAKTLKGIMHKLDSCQYRIAFTGTLQESKCERLIIEGLFGMTKNVVAARDMINQGYAPDLDIDCIVLKYPERICNQTIGMTFQEERKFIANVKERNDFISDLTENLKGNTLVLVDLVKDHGIPMYEHMKEHSNKNVYLAIGDTDGEEREKIRKIAENETGITIVASYGVFSTGVSIKNLHNIVFGGSPGKGKIRVVQSIGRLLRQHDSKDTVKLYDIADDLSVGNKKNFLFKHMMERINIYNKEKHPYRVIPIKLFD